MIGLRSPVEQPMQQRQRQQGQELPPFDQQRMERPPSEQRGAQQAAPHSEIVVLFAQAAHVAHIAAQVLRTST